MLETLSSSLELLLRLKGLPKWSRQSGPDGRENHFKKLLVHYAGLSLERVTFNLDNPLTHVRLVMLELTRLEFIDVKAAVHTFLLESRTKPDHGTITPCVVD